MLLTVEGGVFFSSSASGYRSGLSLLLLGRRREEGQMRVLPWTQNQFVEREVDPNLHLASRRSPTSYRCSSFTCFRHISTVTEGPNLPKVGPLCRSVSLPDSASASASQRSNDSSTSEMERAIPPKSILKRSSTDCSALVGQATDALGLTREEQDNVSICIERRKVHWTDKCGKELAEIREFELRYACWTIQMYLLCLVPSVLWSSVF